MTVQAYDYLKHDVVSSQASAATALFGVMNVFAMGTLTPYARAVEHLCHAYTSTAMAMMQPWGASFTPQRNQERTEPQQTRKISPTEAEIMQRQKPDYSNLRAAAEGSGQSIIDNDAYWNDGIQGSNAKSPHKLGTERERVVFEQRLNETA